ncbi:hypothetical protein DPMN_145973 [Dreissena polymorpha]|uniref:Uncharacterized protein n=1 Tax=Dreissena polymorpha TaxID=45954 RepID=A0A9D4F9G8_DREPO|nr:hypothetical protein DPMN_145973 [Dreissena polymorpha]
MGYTVSSAQHGDHRGLYRQQRTPGSSSRVKPSAAHTLVIIVGYTVSSAHTGHHRGFYRQQRTYWSSSRVIPSAAHTLVIIVVVIVILSVSSPTNDCHIGIYR